MSGGCGLAAVWLGWWLGCSGSGSTGTTPAPVPAPAAAAPAPAPIVDDPDREGPIGMEFLTEFVGDWPKLTMQGETLVLFQGCAAAAGIPGIEIVASPDGGYLLRDRGTEDVFDLPITTASIARGPGGVGGTIRIAARGPDGPRKLEIKLAESGQSAEVKWLAGGGDPMTVATPTGKPSFKTVVEPQSACHED